MQRTRDDFYFAVGKYAATLEIDFERIERLVFVCRGNVCRSPFAAALAEQAGYDVESCGLDVRQSRNPPDNAIAAARLRGVDLSEHFSKPISQLDIGDGDCLIGMEPMHLEGMLAVQRATSCQATLLGIWRTPPIVTVRDPYGGEIEKFVDCYEVIAAAFEGFAARLALPEARLSKA